MYLRHQFFFDIAQLVYWHAKLSTELKICHWSLGCMLYQIDYNQIGAVEQNPRKRLAAAISFSTLIDLSLLISRCLAAPTVFAEECLPCFTCVLHCRQGRRWCIRHRKGRSFCMERSECRATVLVAYCVSVVTRSSPARSSRLMPGEAVVGNCLQVLLYIQSFDSLLNIPCTCREIFSLLFCFQTLMPFDIVRVAA